MSEVSHRFTVGISDRRLAGQEFRTLAALETKLTPYDFRRVKVSSIVHTLFANAPAADWHVANVARHIRKLHALGYIERGPDDGRMKTYRLGTPREVVTHATRRAA